jgi:hypothetical protein
MGEGSKSMAEDSLEGGHHVWVNMENGDPRDYIKFSPMTVGLKSKKYLYGSVSVSRCCGKTKRKGRGGLIQ